MKPGELKTTLQSIWQSSVWPSSYCFTLARVVSDHNPIIFNGLKRLSSGPKPFRYQRMWLEHESFRKVVSYTWNSVPPISCPMQHLVCELKTLKGRLKDWNVNVFGNVHAKMQAS
ncbi:hypothetical protein Dsin_000450 [Dipteronia sinensis]|uniref:Reverse transcriptase n=1 Tax=Dipteronia sinensis TaxID=43782 RepID=A0AAE0B3F9_9ROSI|nr:hypothetical protein Dsin_000450 [Dipteronia sinensis]